jgi:hypothetical protein
MKARDTAIVTAALAVGVAIIVAPLAFVATGALTWPVAVGFQIAAIAAVWVAAQLIGAHRHSSSAH